MFGQLEDVHKTTHKVTPQSSAVTYNGSVWTKNNGILMEFLHLGRALDLITPFFEKAKFASISNTIVPTLSPRDPNFDSWYEGYKAQMNKTQRAPGGSEPCE